VVAASVLTVVVVCLLRFASFNTLVTPFLTEPTMALNDLKIPLGTAAADFSLPGADGRVVTLAGARGTRGTVIAFWANHCPFVKLIRDEFVRFAQDVAPKGISVVLINSGDATAYPDESRDRIREEALSWGNAFPYLIDSDQKVAKAYRALVTPDLLLFDADLKLYYHGQFDEARPKGTIAVTGSDLRGAADALIAGRSAPAIQSHAIGCGIKWKPGNEPDYLVKRAVAV
jgi:thiol-disulfide isomerase/thioredoxin